jgi:ABC-type phosphate/phosphonate transport system substrate-binding protein
MHFARFTNVLLLATLALAGLPTVTATDGPALEPPEFETIRLGITRNQISGIASRDVAISIDYWFRLMSERKGSRNVPVTRIFEDLGEMEAALRRQELDMVFILARDYLALRDEISLEPVAITVGDGGELIRYAVYTRRKRGIRHLDQLRGGRIILDETEGATLGKLWFETLLLRMGIDPEEFAVLEVVGRTSQAVLPVYFGQADACVTAVSSYETTARLNPDIDRALEVVDTSDDAAVGIVCYTDKMDPLHKPEITGALLAMHEDSYGRQILALFRRKRAIPFEPDQIRLVVELEDEHARLEAGRRSGRTN